MNREELANLLDYNPLDGTFTWRYGRKGTAAGTVAGFIGKDGYNIIMINGKNYYAACLAWLYMTNEWPENDVEHKDTNRSNDRFSNLRQASRSQNNQNANMRSDTTTGYKGVSFIERLGKYRAYIRSEGKQIHLGTFSSAEEAAQVYDTAAKSIFGEFARTNFDMERYQEMNDMSPKTNPEVQEALSKRYVTAAIVVPLSDGISFAVFANDRSQESMTICHENDLPIVIAGKAHMAPKRTNTNINPTKSTYIDPAKAALIDFSDL